MVVNDVEQDGHAALMSCVYKSFQLIRTPVAFLHGEWVTRVIAPGVVPRKLVHGHQLDGIYSDALQIIEFGHGACKISWPTTWIIHERSNMHLINDHLVPSWRLITTFIPRIGGIENDRVSHGIGDLLFTGVNAPQSLIPVSNDIFVLLTRMGIAIIDGPMAVSFTLKRRNRSVPTVKIACNMNRTSERCPNTKYRSMVVRYGPHATKRCRLCL